LQSPIACPNRQLPRTLCASFLNWFYSIDINIICAIINKRELFMDKLLNEERFNFISKENRNFIIKFSEQMNLMDYDFGGAIGDGYCWGHFMVIYSRKKKVIARIFIRDKGSKM
jgi:hypothetical protein